MLQFFKEHENLRSAPRPVFPIFVPSSDIYQMKGMWRTARLCMKL